MKKLLLIATVGFAVLGIAGLLFYSLFVLGIPPRTKLIRFEGISPRPVLYFRDQLSMEPWSYYRFDANETEAEAVAAGLELAEAAKNNWIAFHGPVWSRPNLRHDGRFFWKDGGSNSGVELFYDKTLGLAYLNYWET